MGISSKLGRWLHSFLTDRKQVVAIEGAQSALMLVTNGVPHGSLLGPLLFIAYNSDIDQNIQHSFVSSFTDDTCVLQEISLSADAELLQADLDSLYQWAEKNNMMFNGSKFEHMSYTVQGCNNCPPKYTANYGSQISVKPEVRGLGVTLSCDGNFTSHINHVTKKALSQAGWYLLGCRPERIRAISPPQTQCTLVKDRRVELNGEEDGKDLVVGMVLGLWMVVENDMGLGMVVKDQGLGMVVKDQGLGIVVKDQGLGMVVKDQLLGMVVKDQGLGMVVKDQGLGMVVKDQGLGMVVKDQGLVMVVKDQGLGMEAEKDQGLGMVVKDQGLGMVVKDQGRDGGEGSGSGDGGEGSGTGDGGEGSVTRDGGEGSRTGDGGGEGSGIGDGGEETDIVVFTCSPQGAFQRDEWLKTGSGIALCGVWLTECSCQKNLHVLYMTNHNNDRKNISMVLMVLPQRERVMVV
ncbi:hypothetical protein Pcinc_027606 [Petrolisthes cinctipes]|uniref:Reverse transcriptase domain-containing protein n=1 Tax=Petrolisthes cinctipes TaxID=88211 RepID=A0AAE1F4K6_PETCI|nr:hypothetical protein Pcinc_027606 [Petrolisthes cinctipes]